MAILQKVQPRVQMSPIIIIVACPWLQHSPTLGHPASSQTVTNPFSLIKFFVFKYSLLVGALTLIQLGFLGCLLSDRCAFSGWRSAGIFKLRILAPVLQPNFIKYFHKVKILYHIPAMHPGKGIYIGHFKENYQA